MVRRVRRVAALLLVTVVLVSFVEGPWFVVTAGPVLDVAALVEVNGAQGLEAGDHVAGQWLMATVSARPATLTSALWAGVHPVWEVVPRARLVPPGIDIPAYLEINRRLMEESQLVAGYVALRWAGRGAQLRGDGAAVLAVWPGTPAAAAGLAPGDVIKRIGDRPVRLVDDALDALAEVDGAVTVSVWREGALRRVQLVGASSGGDANRWGMILATHGLHARFEVPIRFRLNDVTGPSAGLAFALFIAHRLAGEDLVPDSSRIVATGILRADGRVLAVGGVRHKARAARAAGADLFLVPADNAAAARAAAPDLPVAGVSTFAEALQRLTAASGRRYNGAVRGGGSLAD